ncbi:MAG TPA: OsmC family protein [Conexibacter sp.]|jgi:uncharacterized OsmC-like protein|nr:OsmC family protein [Conexibacter sp.]
MSEPAAAAARELLYRSHVTVRPGDGPDKLVTLAPEPGELVMGAHGALARHLGVPAGHPERASTLDYVAAAAIACMSGTFVRALRAREVPVTPESYAVEGHGDVRLHARVPVLERIVVRHTLRVDRALAPLVERVHATYHRGCAVSQSLAGAIEIESTLLLSDGGG